MIELLINIILLFILYMFLILTLEIKKSVSNFKELFLSLYFFIALHGSDFYIREAIFLYYF